MYRKTHKIFGKLDNFYNEKWSVGIIKSLKEFGENNELKVIGKMPGMFNFISNPFPDYPRYALNYLNSFLKSGILLEDIDFEKKPETFKNAWENIISNVKTNEKGSSYLEKLAKEYSNFQETQQNLWLKDKKIKQEVYVENCINKFNYLSSK